MITPAILQLIGESTNGEDLANIIDQIIELDPKIENDLINIKAQALTADRKNAVSEYTPAEYNSALARQRAGLLTFVNRKRVRTTPTLERSVIQTNPILFLSAVPVDQQPLQTDLEYRHVKKEVASSLYRDLYPLLEPVLAATILDMHQALARGNPAIFHISSHADDRGLALSNDENKQETVSEEAFRATMAAISVQLLFVNACYSSSLVESISKSTPFVISMTSPIIDDTAVLFSRAFYGVLCNTNPPDYEKAFKLAKAALMVRHPDQQNIPQLWKNGAVIA